MKFNIYRKFSNLIDYSNIKLKDEKDNVIMLFHSIEDKDNKKDDLYQMNLEKFKDIIIFLNNIYEFEYFDNCFKRNGKIIITFDDGYLNNLDTVSPFLDSYGIPMHLFVATDLIESNSNVYLGKSELKELSNLKYVTIGSHGKSHSKLTNLSNSNLKNELEYSKNFLEDLTGVNINSISYPHGSYNHNVIKEAELSKYEKGASSIFGSIRYNTNKFLIPRIDIWSNDTIKTVKQKINGYWNWLNIINKIKGK